MRIIYSDITYEEAEKFWRKQGNAMHDRKERLLKTISRMVEMVCGLAVLVYVGVTWKTKILPDVWNICNKSGKIHPFMAASISLITAGAFMAVILLLIQKIIKRIVPWLISWLLKGTENEYDALWGSFLDELRFQNNLRTAFQKNEDAPLDIQESRLILCGETAEGMHFQSMNLNGKQRSKLLAEGVLDFSGADQEWKRIKNLFVTE